MKTLMRILWFTSAILLIFMGGYCLLNPGVAVTSLAYWLAFSVLFHGITTIAQYSSVKGTSGAGFALFDGIISTLFGILLLFTNAWAFIAISLPIFFGIWVLVKGVIGIVRSFQAKKEGAQYWYLLLIVGILGALFGTLAFARPLVAVFAIAAMVGMQLITSGVASMSAWFVARKISQ